MANVNDYKNARILKNMIEGMYRLQGSLDSDNHFKNLATNISNHTKTLELLNIRLANDSDSLVSVETALEVRLDEDSDKLVSVETALESRIETLEAKDSDTDATLQANINQQVSDWLVGQGFDSDARVLIETRFDSELQDHIVQWAQEQINDSDRIESIANRVTTLESAETTLEVRLNDDSDRLTAVDSRLEDIENSNNAADWDGAVGDITTIQNKINGIIDYLTDEALLPGSGTLPTKFP